MADACVCVIERVCGGAGGVEIRPLGKRARSGIKSGTSVRKKGKKHEERDGDYQS